MAFPVARGLHAPRRGRPRPAARLRALGAGDGPSRAEPAHVRIDGLRAWCVVGVRDWERRVPQAVRVGLEVELTPAAQGFDTKRLKDRVHAAVAASSCRLLEELADVACAAAIGEPGVAAAAATVAKPGALRGADVVAVTVRKEAPHAP